MVVLHDCHAAVFRSGPRPSAQSRSHCANTRPLPNTGRPICIRFTKRASAGLTAICWHVAGRGTRSYAQRCGNTSCRLLPPRHRALGRIMVNLDTIKRRISMLCALAPLATARWRLALSWRYLRWFGNMSYSYYLVHGFVVLFCLHALFRVFGSNDGLFWVFLVPVFAFTICGGALLFLFVEKPYSLREGVGKIDTRRLAA